MEKVYCKNCRFYRELPIRVFAYEGICKRHPTIQESFYGQTKIYADCCEKNHNNNCTDFLPKRNVFQFLYALFFGILSTAVDEPEELMEDHLGD